MLVMKFGGTSVGNAERIANVASLVKAEIKRKPVVVVSAVTKITNDLIALAQGLANGSAKEILKRIIDTHEQILVSLSLDAHLLDEEFGELTKLTLKSKSLDKKKLDHIASFGERLSSKIVAAQLNTIGVKAKAFPAWEVGMITNANFGHAEPLETSYELMHDKILALKVVPVITGFIGMTEKGDITTLGRGGSDYSAAIIGGAIDAEAIQIWTDVDGVMTMNPKDAKKATTIRELSFEEASELAYFGVKVIHPKTILPAMRRKIPVQVLNTFNPKDKGTTIVSDYSQLKAKNNKISGLTFKSNVTSITVKSPEFFDGNTYMSKIFSLFAKYDTLIDVVLTSVASVSLLTSDVERLNKIIPALEKIGAVEISSGKSIVCVIGGRLNTAEIIGKIFTKLGEHKISTEMISQASLGISLTFVVEDHDAQKTLKILHEECIDS